MGVLIGTGVHYATGEDPCQAAIVVLDNPPDYDSLSLRVLDAGIPAADAVKNGVLRDGTGPLDTWHYSYECPYA